MFDIFDINNNLKIIIIVILFILTNMIVYFNNLINNFNILIILYFVLIVVILNCGIFKENFFNSNNENYDDSQKDKINYNCMYINEILNSKDSYINKFFYNYKESFTDIKYVNTEIKKYPYYKEKINTIKNILFFLKNK